MARVVHPATPWLAAAEDSLFLPQANMAPLSQKRNNRAAAKQQLLANIENEKFDPAAVDPRSKQDTQMLIDYMQAKLDNQIQLLHVEKESTLNKLKQAFDNNMFKMAKQTKQMTISEFNSANSCDIAAIVRNTKESFRGSKAAATSSSANSAAVPSTPAMDRRNKIAAETPRTVRRGERVKHVSQNGSPVELYDEGDLVVTVKKNQQRQPSLEIHVGQGKFINIDDADQLKEATSEEKVAARDQLALLRKQIDNLMGTDW